MGSSVSLKTPKKVETAEEIGTPDEEVVSRYTERKALLLLLGLPKSGKSTLFKQIIEHLSQSNQPGEIVYINFDDPYFAEYLSSSKNIYTIIETAEKLSACKTQYLLLDEIQNVTDWEKFVKSSVF